jgi:hypothetical protein
MLGATLTAYAELVGDLLVNECGQQVPARVLRYYGHAVPDDANCDGETGWLSVWWDGPMTAPGAAPCPGPLRVTLAARYMRCWKLPKVTQRSITLEDTHWDVLAAEMADVAECVARGLLRLSCPPLPAGPEGEKMRALVAHFARPFTGFVQAVPAEPSGGVFGVRWDLECSLRATPVDGPETS